MDRRSSPQDDTHEATRPTIDEVRSRVSDEPREEEKKRAHSGNVGRGAMAMATWVLSHKRKYAPMSTLTQLHSDSGEGEGYDPDRDKLKRLLHSLNLDHLTARFMAAGCYYYELFKDTEEKCRHVGVTHSAEIAAIVNKVMAILERPAGADSPGTRSRVIALEIGEEGSDLPPEGMFPLAATVTAEEDTGPPIVSTPQGSASLGTSHYFRPS